MCIHCHRNSFYSGESTRSIKIQVNAVKKEQPAPAPGLPCAPGTRSGLNIPGAEVI